MPSPRPVYATIADLETFGVAADALADIDPTIKNTVLAGASRTIDGFLAAQFTLPIVAWGVDVTMVCCQIAAYRLLANRGLNPEGIDQVVRDGYDDGMALLKLWARNDGAVPDVTDSSPQAQEQTPTARPSVSSEPGRGWSANGLTGGRSGSGVPFSGGR